MKSSVRLSMRASVHGDLQGSNAQEAINGWIIAPLMKGANKQYEQFFGRPL